MECLFYLCLLLLLLFIIISALVQIDPIDSQVPVLAVMAM